jgi:hypothetical protein
MECGKGDYVGPANCVSQWGSLPAMAWGSGESVKGWNIELDKLCIKAILSIEFLMELSIIYRSQGKSFLKISLEETINL